MVEKCNARFWSTLKWERVQKKWMSWDETSHQSHLSTTLERSTASSSNKEQSQKSFISISKARNKRTVYSTVCRKKQIMTHDNDRDENDGGDVEGGTSAGWVTHSSQNTCRPKRSRRWFIMTLLASSLFFRKICERGIF